MCLVLAVFEELGVLVFNALLLFNLLQSGLFFELVEGALQIRVVLLSLFQGQVFLLFGGLEYVEDVDFRVKLVLLCLLFF